MDIRSVAPQIVTKGAGGARVDQRDSPYIFAHPPSLVPDARAQNRGSVWGGDHTVASRSDVPQPPLDPGPWSGFFTKGASRLSYLRPMGSFITRTAVAITLWGLLGSPRWLLTHASTKLERAHPLASVVITISYHFPGSPSWLVL